MSRNIWAGIVVVVIIATGGVYWYLTQNSQTRPVATVQVSEPTQENIPAETDVCTLSVDGNNYSISPCNEEDYGAYGINFGSKGSKYFVDGVNTTGPIGGYWNGPDAASHAQDPLPGGQLIKNGSCYENLHVKLCEASQSTSNKTQTTNTNSNSKTYTNTQYGFAVNYPSDTTLDLSNPGRFSNGSVSFSLGSVQTGMGRVDMGFPLSASYCDLPKTDASHTAPTDLITKTIGGINFSVYTNTSAPPTESFKERIYQGLSNGQCYFFSETIIGGSVLSSAQIQTKLDAIVNSFHFTNQ